TGVAHRRPGAQGEPGGVARTGCDRDGDARAGGILRVLPPLADLGFAYARKGGSAGPGRHLFAHMRNRGQPWGGGPEVFGPQMREKEEVLAQVATSPAPAESARHAQAPAAAALSPAVCYHVYESLADRVIDCSQLITVQGTCWRHEGANLRTL